MLLCTHCLVLLDQHNIVSFLGQTASPNTVWFNVYPTDCNEYPGVLCLHASSLERQRYCLQCGQCQCCPSCCIRESQQNLTIAKSYMRGICSAKMQNAMATEPEHRQSLICWHHRAQRTPAANKFIYRGSAKGQPCHTLQSPFSTCAVSINNLEVSSGSRQIL